jgi:tRNA(Ile)-lysidine synthase
MVKYGKRGVFLYSDFGYDRDRLWGFQFDAGGDVMLAKVIKAIREQSLFAPEDTVVVAVSGGADSVALLDILASLPEFRLNLVIAHLNHMLRGVEADGDEEFVRGLAVSYQVPVLVKRVDVAVVARRERRSLEDAGRVVRYAFLDEVAALHGARVVALAHHADDQAETVLLRLLRGAGGSGLCAMAPKTAGRYVRPLLAVTRREIETYLQRQGLAFRTDSSNGADIYLRNRIRHELIPLLGLYNPAISERLVATAEALAADEEFLEAATDTAFASHAVLLGDGVRISAPGLGSELRGIRLRLYRRAILKVKGDLARIGFRHLQEIDRLLLSPKPNLTLSLPNEIHVTRGYGEVTFSQGAGKGAPLPYEFFVDGPGIYPLPGGGELAVDLADRPADLGSSPATTAWFALDRAPFPWLVRTFRDGDRLAPLGMSGHKKVKKLFIDRKVPLPLRRRVPLLFCGEALLWVGGIRVGNGAALTTGTKEAVRVELTGFGQES